MPSLHETQQAFLNAIFARDSTEPLLASLVDGQPGAQRRLSVYRGTVFHNLREALRAVFPVVERLVGREFFDFAAEQHIVRTASRSGNIQGYGEEFADFLAGFDPAAGLPYLSDVARLEWYLHEVFHACDAPALELSRLAQVAPRDHGRLAFRIHPACRLLASPYPVHAIWRENQQSEAAEIRLDSGGVALLVRRRDDIQEILPLETGEFRLLTCLAAGQPLAAALEEALAAQPGLDAIATLSRHVQQGTLTDFHVTNIQGETHHAH